MSGFVDLHCHCVPGVDDGAPTLDEGVGMLRALGAAGFEAVIATPHMRPGMWDPEDARVQQAFASVCTAAAGLPAAPRLSLSSEHYYDATVIERLLQGGGRPYPGSKAALIEFYEVDFPPSVDRKLFELQVRGILPVIAHPERYRVLWKNTDPLERLIRAGAVALLDVAALDGKYGRAPQRCAEDLLERELYHAACTDSHRVADVAAAQRGIAAVRRRYGEREVDFLLRHGPAEILAGRVPE